MSNERRMLNADTQYLHCIFRVMPEIHYEFVETLPSSLNAEPILISGEDSLMLNGVEYLVIKENRVIKEVFQIRYEYHSGPFKQAQIVDNLLVVGFSNFFYLYDRSAQTNLVAIELDGYFGHLYINNGLFYIAGAGSILCLDKKGKIVWLSDWVGIDGVIIREFTTSQISGSGEWDPPNGWRSFTLDLNTGKLLGNIGAKL